MIENINENFELPAGAILVSVDVSALYTNIPQDEGIEAVREALLERENPEIPTDFIIRLLEIVLKYNIFEFNSELFLQLIGTAMGTRPAVSYANIFMARRIDQQILDLAEQLGAGTSPILCFKRFLDDIFMIYTGSVENLHKFLEELNNLHPTIKFTMNHTMPPSPTSDNPTPPPPPCQCNPTESLAFLDTSLSIKDGKIITDLYRKPTDRNQYLLPSSCHPAHVTDNIPFSLAYRIVRICTEPETRDIRLTELKQLLLSRNYKQNIVNAAIEKAKLIPRQKAIEKVESERSTTRRPVFAVTYDPRLPSLPGILKKHWRTMVGEDPYLKEVFPLPPLVAYKRPPNIKDKLIRSKIPSNTSQRPRRIIPGMTKCNKCPICPFVKTGKTVKATATNLTVDINKPVNCQTKNMLYCISCDRCPAQYIGESDRTLQERFSEHRGYVKNEHLNKATGEHFNKPGHQLSDMRVSILEKIFSTDPAVRKERELHFIKQMNTKYKGMNRKT